MPIPLPPLSEQQAIATYLDSKCTDIDRLIAVKQQKIEKLKDYKKSVIYEAVTGKTIIE
jgi:type I restriction enzyme S subunit